MKLHMEFTFQSVFFKGTRLCCKCFRAKNYS